LVGHGGRARYAKLSKSSLNIDRRVATRFFVNFIFMCLYMLVCDYLSLGVFSWVFVLEGYFGLLMSKGNLVIP